jgi:AcrR family transcriptional regulator
VAVVLVSEGAIPALSIDRSKRQGDATESRHDAVMEEPVPRRRGRPRLATGNDHGDTREEILQAAGHLFATQGYAATGTREIAALVGVRQASLFHHFARKEDILAELLDRTVSPPLAAAADLDAGLAPPDVRLFALARHDATNLCGTGHNLSVLQLLPEARGPRFASFWDKRAELRARYETLIAEAAAAGLLADLPVSVVTDIVFGAVEATMTWYDEESTLGPAEAGDAVAGTAVRGVLCRPPTIDALREAADALDASVPRRPRVAAPQ